MKFLFIVVSLALLSCHNGKKSAIHEQLDGTDSLVVRFNNGKETLATDRKAIDKMIRFVDDKAMDSAGKCDHDGGMFFYGKSVLKGEVYFNYSKQACRHFMLNVNGRMTKTVMGNEAADFLKAMAEGRDFY